MPSPTPQTFHLVGNVITVLSSPLGGSDKFMVAECRTKPGAGSPHNRHPGDDESFYVLTGEFEFIVDGKRQHCGPGGFVTIPNGSPHQFTNAAMADSTMLIICSPGIVHERFFREAGQPLDNAATEFSALSSTPDLAALRATAERCGIEFLPPAN